MNSEFFDGPGWARTADGDIVLRLIEGWDAGVTEHGDIAMSFISTLGNDPGPHEDQRAQFLCTREDARQIAHMILRTLAYSETPELAAFTAFRQRIQSPALAALADDWAAARGSRRMPAWEDLKPAPDAPYLGGIWAYDYRHETGDFIGRLAGSTIALAFGAVYKDKELRELYPPQVADLVRSHLMRVVTEPSCVLYSGKLFRIGEQTYEGERLILPIGADPARPDGVLGVSHYASLPLSYAAKPLALLADKADWCRV